jgi:hypothetical protein
MNQNPFFKIEQYPILFEQKITDGGSEFFDISNRMAIVNVENNVVLGIVSKNYTPVMNKDVYNLFQEALKHFKIKKEIHHLDRGGRKWFCDFVISGNQTEFDITGGGDIVGILIRAFNAYNGKNTFGWEIMGYRYMCENGQIFGKQSLSLRTFRHFFGKADKLMADFSLQFRLFESNVELWAKWTQREYWTDDLRKFLEDKEYIGERLKTHLIEMHLSKHYTTKWDVYNLLTYEATHKTSGKDGISGVFTNKYKVLTKLIEDFYKIPLV